MLRASKLCDIIYSCIMRPSPIIAQYNHVICRNIFTHTIKLQQNQRITKKEPVTVVFIHPDGRKTQALGKEGDTLLDVVVENNVDLDGFGACEGTLACSTCHLIFKQSDLDKVGSQPSDEELDMLDLAYGLTETSRLGCQIHLKKELDPLEVTVPATINDARL
ncbi:Adrenodoxin-like protein 2, mitochondrial, partial [Fragariocoptes setiger]